jgi:hypothetical protein
MAGAVWTSGTAFGGTGGGRSVNIWAKAGAGSSAAGAKASAKASVKATARAGKGHLPRPNPTIPLPPEIMAMLFTENAANSSLRSASSAGIGSSGTGIGTQC